MSRTRFDSRLVLSTAALTAVLLGTACSDATAPTHGEGLDAGAGLEQPVAKPDLGESGAAGSGTEPALATASAVQVGADTVAQIGVLGRDGRPESVPAGARGGDVVPGQYIVIFKDNVSDAPGLSKRLIADHRGSLRRTFHVFKGFSANLPAAAAEALRHNPNVDVVEPVRVVTTAATQYMATGSGRAWGLDRIDQVNRPLSGSMTYARTGYGVTAYIIDTGILASHGEFGGRARNVATVFGDAGSDCHGHGTHVAGIVGGRRTASRNRSSSAASRCSTAPRPLPTKPSHRGSTGSTAIA